MGIAPPMTPKIGSVSNHQSRLRRQRVQLPPPRSAPVRRKSEVSSNQMLTDIFARRYAAVPMWEKFCEEDRRLLVQSFRIIREQLFPLNSDGRESAVGETSWKVVHDKLSMELGLESLSTTTIWYNQTYLGKTSQFPYVYKIADVCKNFVCADFPLGGNADRFMKERLSFVELAFREREIAVADENAKFPRELALAELRDKTTTSGRPVLPGKRADSVRHMNDVMNANFFTSVLELNERFVQAQCKLHYHNGFIQRTTDARIEQQIDKGFWPLLADPMWKNVDTDIKDAIDRRDTDDRDPAFYAARALESTIKIISDKRGWTHGGEKGAHNYIDNLASKANHFIDDWEATILKSFFTHVRNPFGHGPGSKEMPSFNDQQTSCAIEMAMSWIKSLVQRLQ
jgi:hypothetical protein